MFNMEIVKSNKVKCIFSGEYFLCALDSPDSSQNNNNQLLDGSVYIKISMINL